MVSYNCALDIKSLIAPDAIEGNTPTDGRSEYVGERRPLASFVNTGPGEREPPTRTATPQCVLQRTLGPGESDLPRAYALPHEGCTWDRRGAELHCCGLLLVWGGWLLATDDPDGGRHPAGAVMLVVAVLSGLLSLVSFRWLRGH